MASLPLTLSQQQQQQQQQHLGRSRSPRLLVLSLVLLMLAQCCCRGVLTLNKPQQHGWPTTTSGLYGSLQHMTESCWGRVAATTAMAAAVVGVAGAWMWVC